MSDVQSAWLCLVTGPIPGRAAALGGGFGVSYGVGVAGGADQWFTRLAQSAGHPHEPFGSPRPERVCSTALAGDLPGLRPVPVRCRPWLTPFLGGIEHLPATW